MIDFEKLQATFRVCAGRVKYRLGAKAQLNWTAQQMREIDCSGWVRYALHDAMGIVIPDGSQNQLAWARANLRKLKRYADVDYAKADRGRLFIAFLSPAPGKQWPRHVWLLRSDGREMVTMESYGGKGVWARSWNVKALAGCVDCFELV